MEKIITEILWFVIKPIWYAARFIKEASIAIWEWLVDNKVFAVVGCFLLFLAWCYVMLWLEYLTV